MLRINKIATTLSITNPMPIKTLLIGRRCKIKSVFLLKRGQLRAAVLQTPSEGLVQRKPVTNKRPSASYAADHRVQVLVRRGGSRKSSFIT